MDFLSSVFSTGHSRIHADKKQNIQLSAFAHFSRWMSPSELRERVKSLWSAVAIISALVATISCGGLIALSPTVIAFPNSTAQILYTILIFSSAWTCLVSAMLITAAWTALEETPEEFTRDFFEQFSWMIQVPNALLTFGSIFLALAFVILVFETSSPVTFGVCVVVFACLTIFIRYCKQLLKAGTEKFIKETNDIKLEEISQSGKNGSSSVQ